MSKSEDLMLVARVNLSGDKTAFDLLTRKYQSSIRRFFLNLTMGDNPLSDDLAQETFIKAYLNLNGFQGLSGFSTWLFRIAYNVHYDYVRSRKITGDINELEINRMHEVQNEFSAERTDINEALMVLRTEERTAILLFYMEDKTHQEIAKIMQCPLGTVKTYILKGKEKLGAYLKNAGYGN
ncbi:MAG: sigma-70 family RNA polymerase sigma factor [Paludibacter sp.]|jgi:RNA polymerase sigma-70 factor (ECF subfamily)|nr:sigma-70 family RNA polymerase sigma factor [Paludibacter sp.]